MGSERLKDYTKKIKRINKVIDADYRQKNYSIAYVCYKKSSGGLDTELLSELFQFKQSDIFVDAGVSLKDLNDYIYPDESKLLQNLMPVDRLVVAGFHYTDCVTRFFKAAKEMGIDSMIDRALTEGFFYLIKKGDIRKALRKLDRTALKSGLWNLPATNINDVTLDFL
ncbi:MAG: hypothetical protein JW791_03110 [Nanoarchaeota archaeon]|nr:hypothetical protein [Nanoarchaeota archaeon]